MIIQSSSAALTHSVLKSLQWWQTHLRAEQWHSGDVKANQRADQLVQVRFMLECVRVCAQMRAEASPVGVYKKKQGGTVKAEWAGPAPFSLCVQRSLNQITGFRFTWCVRGGAPVATSPAHLPGLLAFTCSDLPADLRKKKMCPWFVPEPKQSYLHIPTHQQPWREERSTFWVGRTSPCSTPTSKWPTWVSPLTTGPL